MVISMVYIYKSQHNQIVAENQSDQSRRNKLKKRLKLFIGVLIMVVLGWGSAVIASDENTPFGLLIVLFILFLLFGFGQGFYLFFFACVFNFSVRRDWKEMVFRAAHLSVKTRTGSSTDSNVTSV